MKLMCRNELFQSSKTKNKIYTTFKDKNNSLYFFFFGTWLNYGCTGHSVAPPDTHDSALPPPVIITTYKRLTPKEHQLIYCST